MGVVYIGAAAVFLRAVLDVVLDAVVVDDDLRRFPTLADGTWWSRAFAMTFWCVPLILLEVFAVAAVWAM